MNRKQYSDTLKKINKVRESGDDVAACIESFRKKYKYVYAYKDTCFKKIFGTIAMEPGHRFKRKCFCRLL